MIQSCSGIRHHRGFNAKKILGGGMGQPFGFGLDSFGESAADDIMLHPEGRETPAAKSSLPRA